MQHRFASVEVFAILIALSAAVRAEPAGADAADAERQIRKSLAD